MIQHTDSTATFRKPNLEMLNKVFNPLSPLERLQRLYDFFPPEDVLYTSSFGTKSRLLLSYIARVQPAQVVHFIDTTYHFPETIQYRNELGQRLGLQLKNVLPDPVQNALTREEEWWKDHPKMCCTVNKVAALRPVIDQHRIWISGIMSSQTQFRSTLQIFEKQGDIIKFQPLIDLPEEAFHQEISELNVPPHPLEAEGYGSIGCTHCTVPGAGREGRWAGQEKKECGLHPSYFTKKS